MQVGNMGNAGNYSVPSTESKVSGDKKAIEGDSSEKTFPAVSSDTVSISSDAMRLLSEDDLSTDSNSEVVPLGNGSGTIPDLNSSTSSDDPTPGNGSGTVPPDLGRN